jgi:flagellin
MSLAVNFNSGALNAYRNLSGTEGMLQKSIQRLSSGLRVNSAADDPSGLVISEQMRAQSEGLGQAIRNANDGINLVKTAEGALNEVHGLLRHMRTLAVHAANAGVNSTEDVAADQQALDDAVASIDRISEQTRFNGKALLDGSFTAQSFQVGANSTDTEAVSIETTGGDAIDSAGLAVDSLDLDTDAAGAIDAIDAAITEVSTVRSNLGSFQRNTLESAISSLSIAQENIRASESTIRDVDVAAEMVQFTRNNILMQAGTAMLAQANQAPQSLLQLLR